jgi:hypothetical protein
MPTLCPASFPFINGRLPNSSEKPPIYLRNRWAKFLLFVQVSLKPGPGEKKKTTASRPEGEAGTKGEISDVL